jgi:hypothetical protein
MSPGEMAAIMAIYDLVHQTYPPMLGDAVHEAIRAMRIEATDETRACVHLFRVQAEAQIPKPVMKSYKAFLRDGLFG